jgi:hypothetical protein
LTSKNRGREFLDVFRPVFSYITTPMNNEHLLSADLFEKIVSALLEPQTPLRVRYSILYVIVRAHPKELPVLERSMKSFDSKTQAIMHTLTQCLVPSQANIKNALATYVHFYSIQESNMRSCTIAGIMQAVRDHSDMLTNTNHIKPVETQLAEFLARASTVSEQKPSANIFFKLAVTAPTPVTEIDGTTAREFFTILNNSQSFTEDQIFNIFSFSMLTIWLQRIYVGKKSRQMVSRPDFVLSATVQEVIVSYCLRVIDQSKLKPPSQHEPTTSIRSMLENESLPIVALTESVKILDLVCLIDPTLVPRLFPTVKKLFTTHLPPSQQSGAIHTRAQGTVLLSLLQFFVHHSDVVVYDPEPVFRSYFHSYLGSHYNNPAVAFDTLTFCIDNKV